MSTTEREKYHFTVKEFGDSTAWIMMEPYEGDLSCLRKGFLGFDLKPGTDYEKAKEIASFMNQHIVSVSYINI